MQRAVSQYCDPVRVRGKEPVCKPRSSVLCAHISALHEEHELRGLLRSAPGDGHSDFCAPIRQIRATQDVILLEIQKIAIELDPGRHEVVELEDVF